jgi:hypothetical protein
MADRRTAFAFAVDLADEGVAEVLDRLAQRGRLNAIAVTASYHAARDVLVHNPARKVFFHESGVTYFPPDPELYAATPLRPQMASICQGRDLLAETAAAALVRDMACAAWASFLHNTRLGLAHPESCVQNAFGDPLVHSLCPAQEAVSAYCVALARDIARRRPRAIYVESISFLPFDHGWHHERSPSWLNRFDRLLLGLCFCDACAEAAGSSGLDVPWLERLTRDHLSSALSGEPTSLLTLSHDVLAEYLEARRSTVTRLLARVSEAIRAESTATEVVLLDDFGVQALGSRDLRPADLAAAHGLGLAAAAREVDRIATCAYFREPARVEAELRDYRRLVGPEVPLEAILRPYPPDSESAADLAEKVRAALGVGVSDLAFYNYGHMPLQSLDWIGATYEARRARI